MKTRLLRKLRRKAKRRIKITNPLKEQYNIYYIEKSTIKNGYVEKEWFHYEELVTLDSVYQKVKTKLNTESFMLISWSPVDEFSI